MAPRFWPRRVPESPILPSEPEVMYDEDPEAVAAAAVIVEPGRDQHGRSSFGEGLIPKTESWQKELWDQYDVQGEYGFAVGWKASMLSRCRLRAAKMVAQEDEPVVQDSGPGVDLVNLLADGVGGQSVMLGDLAVQLAVPGECWLVGEERPGKTQWTVYSTEEIRASAGKWTVLDEYSNQADTYRELSEDSLRVRIYRPHKRKRNMADSPGRHALSAMRELDLVNREIEARYLSRIATAGMVIFPSEVTLPHMKAFENAEDPFLASWVDIARRAIETRGSASAVLPLPIRVPAEYVDKVRFLDFTTKSDEKLLEKRESAIRRLAGQIDIPAEIMLGMGDVNHWSAWQIEEDAIKSHITPDLELIVGALTKGYLWPMMKAAGIPHEEWVVWYDTSELTMRPDRSAAAKDAYDRFEINGDALRRESGFSDTDAPEDDQLETMILKAMARQPATAAAALAALTGTEAITPTAEPEPEGQEGDVENADQPNDIPDTKEDQPPELSEAAQVQARQAFALRQAAETHLIAKRFDGTYLSHPELCADRQFSCPFTHAARRLRSFPGMGGTYECTIRGDGVLAVGKKHVALANKRWLEMPVVALRAVNAK